MMNAENWDAWNFRVMAGENRPQAENLIGFTARATDGDIGKVIDASTEEGTSWIVVETGLIIGRRVLLPAGTIERIDLRREEVLLDLTKDQVKNSPPPSEETELRPDDEYRAMLGTYYGGFLGPRLR